ncbi:acyl-CoA dehydrogenase family protein [Novosphingobium album (ex Liu et al. 2023)]|uniref:Acyl-CoA dehydrogenase family protein n=1 Tax=Novosphingobium album (ex Liu et al. 2023) TaxID=3031130 RepID=A0ABT5WTG1_9SPHN|nr:acyl-CoA dehydrogenase family protein [Novosphingobium album (ex Liu et al. 2023)]MDE8653172.1 acyl-CoA dehydrogenase family protein [Novosphingobium album (ex Liu et al. 2023)]
MKRGVTESAEADLLERLTGLRDLVEASANERDEASEISAEVIRALEESGLFGLMAPAELGGLEAHPLTVLEALKTLSYFDGSTGWYCQAATTGVAVAGAFLGDRAIEAIFCSDKCATCAGQAAPSGKAERVGDGYRISGTFSFGSGLPNAAWVVGGYILHENGAPAKRDNGQPVMLIALAPRERVEVLGNWNVLGLRGTGSYDFRVEEQIVHADFVFDAANPIQKRGGSLYAMGFSAIPALCHSAFGVGCSERLLDEWAAYAHGKARPQGGTLAQTDTFQRDFAHAHARMRSADAYVRTTFGALYGAAELGSLSDDMRVDGRLCASNVISSAAKIGQAAFASSATTGLRDGGRLQRCYRDLQAANAHFLTGEQSFIDAGRYLVRIPGATPGL